MILNKNKSLKILFSIFFLLFIHFDTVCPKYTHQDFKNLTFKIKNIFYKIKFLNLILKI